jgi:transposase-like protein
MNSKSKSIECPDCQSTRVNCLVSLNRRETKACVSRKNGHKAGKQNHICRDCGRQFIDCYQAQQGYAEKIKKECLSIYVNGRGFRAIERIKGVHHTSIINWVKQVGELLPDAYNPEHIID